MGTIDAHRRVLDAESEIINFRAQLDESEALHEKKIQEISAKIELVNTSGADIIKLKAQLCEIKKKHKKEIEELKEEHSLSTKKIASDTKLEVERLIAQILAIQGKHQTEVQKLNLCVEAAVKAEKEMKTLVVDMEDAEKRHDMEIKKLYEMQNQAYNNTEMKTLMAKMENMENMYLENIEELCTKHKLASVKFDAETKSFKPKLEEAE